jgi:hypothetical protein
MRRPASNCGQDRAATHRSRETGAGGPGTGIADAALQQVHQELASVLIGVQACIEVAVERHRNSGREADQSLAVASTLTGLALATIRQFGADQMHANLHPLPKTVYSK